MIKIIIDSGCDIPREILEQEDVKMEMVPLNLQIEDKSFVDDDSLNIGDYLEVMADSKATPKTSQPSPSSFFAKFLGEESIFVVTLSSALSGTYNSAIMAKQMYLDEIGNKFIHVFDSLTASVGELVVALKVKEFAKKNLPNLEIVESVNKFIGNMRTFIILEKYDNLVKTGRISPVVAKLASVLSIKPICTATREGTIVLAGKAKGYKKSVEKLVELILNDKFDFENRTLAISHIKCLERALYVKDQILERITFREVIIVEARGISATYGDNAGLIVAY